MDEKDINAMKERIQELERALRGTQDIMRQACRDSANAKLDAAIEIIIESARPDSHLELVLQDIALRVSQLRDMWIPGSDERKRP